MLSSVRNAEPGQMANRRGWGRQNRYVGKQVGKYTLLKPVGEGRYGRCYLAYAPDETPVIIKRFKPCFFRKGKRNNSSEAIILSQLNHPGIPQLIDVICEKRFYAFVLEEKQGKTIEAMLFKEHYCFNDREIYRIGVQLLEMVKYLHDKGIVHRDIRIPNVILENETVSLVDFGLARWADGERYNFDSDLSYLGDLLLYLLYSAYSGEEKFRNRPWHEELPLSNEKKYFLKRLLKIEDPYKNTGEAADDFCRYFGV